MATAVYGAPPPELAVIPADAVQASPLVPGAAALEDAADGSLDEAVIAAPAGALERRYVLAHALRALKPGGRLIALAPKDRGGLRLKQELEAFGCRVESGGRRHWRLAAGRRPNAPVGLAAAIADGGPQIPPGLGLASQPGVFSWDRPDPGTALLAQHVGGLAGAGADLGCGVGGLALALLAEPAVARLTLVDIDRRAIAAARRNVTDARAGFLQADLRDGAPLAGLDFVAMNPPFHLDGVEDRGLGQLFIRRAAQVLRRGGLCRLVANVALPYEATLREAFAGVALIDQAHGYKVYEARKS